MRVLCLTLTLKSSVRTGKATAAPPSLVEPAMNDPNTMVSVMYLPQQHTHKLIDLPWQLLNCPDARVSDVLTSWGYHWP